MTYILTSLLGRGVSKYPCLSHHPHPRPEILDPPLLCSTIVGILSMQVLLNFNHCSAAYAGTSALLVPPSLTTSIHHAYLLEAINIYNALVSPKEALSSTIDSIPTHRYVLSQKLENKQFQSLLQSSSLADRARLLSVSSPHARSWLPVNPSPLGFASE